MTTLTLPAGTATLPIAATTDTDHTRARRLTEDPLGGRRLMVNRSGAPQIRTGKGLTVRRSADALTRLKNFRWAKHVGIREWIDHIRGLIAHYIVCSWYYAARGWWRRADWLLVPSVALVAWLAGANWWLVLPVALGSIAYRQQITRRHLPPPIANRVELRTRLRWQRKLNPISPRLTITPGGVIFEGHRTVVRGTLPLEANEADLRAIRYTLGRLFKDPTDITVRVLGQFELYVRHRQLFTTEAERPTIDDVLLDIGAGTIPLGIDINGQRVDWTVHENNLLIGGQRGSGKSTILSSIIDYALNLPHRRFVICDLDAGYDYEWFHPHCDRVETTVPGCLALLEDTADEVQNRIDAGRRVIHDELFVVLDEFQALVNHGDKPVRDRAQAAIGTINNRGRKARVHTLAATQDLRASVITGTLRDQFTHVLGLATKTSIGSDTILGAGSRDFDLSRIPLDQKGRGVLTPSENERFTPLRAFRYLAPDLPPPVSQPPVSSPVFAPDVSQPSPSTPTPSLVSQGEIGPSVARSTPSATELREQVAGKVRAAGQIGVMLSDLMSTLGESKDRVQYALIELKKRGLVEARGKRWHWTGGDG